MTVRFLTEDFLHCIEALDSLTDELVFVGTSVCVFILPFTINLYGLKTPRQPTAYSQSREN